jgi:hypothetical protein
MTHHHFPWFIAQMSWSGLFSQISWMWFRYDIARTYNCRYFIGHMMYVSHCFEYENHLCHQRWFNVNINSASCGCLQDHGNHHREAHGEHRSRWNIQDKFAKQRRTILTSCSYVFLSFVVKVQDSKRLVSLNIYTMSLLTDLLYNMAYTWLYPDKISS